MTEDNNGTMNALQSPLDAMQQLMMQQLHFAQLSLGSCKKLCLVDQDFPLNNTKHRYQNTPSNVIPTSNTIPVTVGVIVEKEVQRNIIERLKTIPDRPTELPFPATEHNIPALEQWLRNAFKGACRLVLTLKASY